MDVSEWIKANVRCCSCGGSLESSRHINILCLNRLATWEWPRWGNILVMDKYPVNRAPAILCDRCVEENREIKFAIEWDNERTYVRYHKVEELQELPEIPEKEILGLNLLTRWLRTKSGRLRDVPVRIGRMVFHIPFDGSNYLMFKCRKCGSCCRGQRWEALLLTEADVKRLSKALNYSSMSEFLDKECVYAEVTEPRQVYPLIGKPPVKATYVGFYLKRFDGENAETVLKPHACRFLTENNLCTIYEARPVVCRKFPYTTYHQEGLTHAYYVNVPSSSCPGYREKRRLKKQWLTPWVKDLIEADREILGAVQSGFFMITEVEA